MGKVVAVIGPGHMGKAISIRLLSGGHDVYLVGKDITKTQASVDEVKMGRIGTGTITAQDENGDWASKAEIVFLATKYSTNLEIVNALRDKLAGKIVVEISNPLNETFDGLVTDPGTSAAEEVQKVLPDSKVFKAFNTTFAGTLVEGQVAGMPLDVFVAGDDDAAKNTLADLIRSCGLVSVNVGPLARARELESLGFLNINVQSTLGTNFMSAIKIIHE